MSFEMYDTSMERVCYVGWLLSCDARPNIDKGERLLLELTAAEQQQAQHHANHLREVYTGGHPDNANDEEEDYQASISRSKRR